MKTDSYYKKFGSPDIKLANVELWILGYEFPEMNDNDDSNWLNVVVICKSPNSHTIVEGSFLQTYNLHSFLKEIEVVNNTLKGKAELASIEPNLHIELQVHTLGQIEMQVSITPDHMTENHEYQFQIDQSYLSDVVNQLKRVLSKYPVKI